MGRKVNRHHSRRVAQRFLQPGEGAVQMPGGHRQFDDRSRPTGCTKQLDQRRPQVGTGGGVDAAGRDGTKFSWAHGETSS